MEIKKNGGIFKKYSIFYEKLKKKALFAKKLNLLKYGRIKIQSTK